MKSIVSKAFSNKIFVFIMLLPFMVPGFIDLGNQYIAAHNFFNYLKIFVAVIICVFFLIERKLPLNILTIFIFYFSFVITSIINSSNVSSALLSMFNLLIFSILITLGIQKNFNILNEVLLFYFFVLWSGELICLFVFPDGITYDNYYYYKCGFINIDNQLAPLMIFSFLILINNLLNENRVIISKICLIVMFTSVFIIWSATCVVAAFILLIYLLLFYKKPIENLVSKKILILAIVILFFAIVMFRIQNVFAFFIENILGKSLTLTGRTEIWDISMERIKKSIIYGYGFCWEHGWILWHSKYFYTHNLILEILMLGGLFSMALFILMLIVNLSKVNLKKDRSLSALINICFFSFGVACFTESYMTSIYFSAMLVLAYNFNNLSIKNKNNV